MATRIGRGVRSLVVLTVLAFVAACSTVRPSDAAPKASIVMDARTGETLFARNADARLHPASLTKMMTLYIAFQAIERGEIGLDSLVTISKQAANEPPSRLGLKAGQRIALRYLIRAAAIKSANDAATAIGEAISGSEAKFAARMNATALAIGMTNSTFKNANGLTQPGHLSTARDLTLLGRRLFYDYPQYYNIFSRRETDAGPADVRNTNRRFLDAYKGADGIKTGFTNAAGFNLTASAEREGVRLVATVLGGTSTADRNATMAELLDLGFRKAPAGTAVQPPPPLDEGPTGEALVAALEAAGAPLEPAKTIRLRMQVATSSRPRPRPPAGAGAATEVAVAAMQDSIAGALAEATGTAPPDAPGPAAAPEAAVAETAVAEVAAPEVAAPEVAMAEVAMAGAAATPGAAATLPFRVADAETMAIVSLSSSGAMAAPPAPKAPTVIHTATPLPEAAPADAAVDVAMEVASAGPVTPTEAEVVMRISTSGGRFWGVNIGRFNSRASAERALMKTMLSESATLNESLRKIVERPGGYDANFMGLSQDQADLACRRLQARGTQCFAIGP